MLIQVDKEGKKVVDSLCDIALKVGGIQNLQMVNIILENTKEIKIEDKEDK